MEQKTERNKEKVESADPVALSDSKESQGKKASNKRLLTIVIVAFAVFDVLLAVVYYWDAHIELQQRAAAKQQRIDEELREKARIDSIALEDSLLEERYRASRDKELLAVEELAKSALKCTFTVKGVTFKMVAVEGGTFKMGATGEQRKTYYDEKPVHDVTLSSYYIGETEVTQALWRLSWAVTHRIS